MITYLSMLTISIVSSYLFVRSNRKIHKIIFLILTIFPFIIVSAIRFDVGTDYFFRYVPNYNTFVEGGNVTSLEFLFRELIKICVLINKDYTILFAITSIIINTLILSSVFKFSKNITISIIIYFVGSFYFQSMNLVRQFIAIAIFIASYRFIYSKKTIPLFFICSLIAILFHSISIVFLIAICLDKRLMNNKILMILIAIILFFGRDILEFILNLTTKFNNDNITKYAHYLKRNGDLALSNIIIEMLIYIYINIMSKNALKNGKLLNKEWIFLYNIENITIISTIMNIHLDLFFRIALFFSIFQIISIPFFYNLNKDCEWKLFNKYLENIKIKNNRIIKILKKWNIIMLIIVILGMTSRMTYSNIIKGADAILPYKTIFNRK